MNRCDRRRVRRRPNETSGSTLSTLLEGRLDAINGGYPNVF